MKKENILAIVIGFLVFTTIWGFSQSQSQCPSSPSLTTRKDTILTVFTPDMGTNLIPTSGGDGVVFSTQFRIYGTPLTLDSRELYVSCEASTTAKNNLTDENLTLTQKYGVSQNSGYTYYGTGVLASAGPYDITFTFTPNVPGKIFFVFNQVAV